MKSKKPGNRTVLLFSLFVIQSSLTFSQTTPTKFSKIYVEKIYLQTDSKVYTTDKTIWFKAIVTNALDHTPTELSGVLYVEFVNASKFIIERKLIKLEKGIGEGFFILGEDVEEGLYQIRAYTQWNKNFGSDFYFKEYIRVFKPTKGVPGGNPFGNVRLVEEEDKSQNLQALLNPNAIDSLHKKEITVFIEVDRKQDSLVIKKNRNDEYPLNYQIPKDSRFVSLQIKTDNSISKLKKLVLDNDYIDLQFFPESGELVDGIESRVAFKALGYDGKGKFVECEIVNEQEEVITTFKSNRLGMGTLILPEPDENTKYYARQIFKTSRENLIKLYPLPDVALKGNVLSVRKRGHLIFLTAMSNYIKSDSVYLQGTSRGRVFYNICAEMSNGKLLTALPVEKLPEGILAFTLADANKQPVAERLFFNERSEQRLNVSVFSDDSVYSQRDKTNLDIQVTDNQGKPANANLSVMVINREQLGKIQDSRHNILTYFLLGSELKGEIEEPGYYFRGDTSRFADLDALMLTQGWRKYIYSKPSNQESPIFNPETTITVSGVVGGNIFQKKKKHVNLTMITFGKNKSFYTQPTDSLGRFSFNLNNEYGQNLNIVIQSANKAGKNKDYTITLNKKESPAIDFNQKLLVEEVDTVTKVLVEKNIQRKVIKDVYPISSSDIMIEEVTVEAYRLTPERKIVVEKYGMPDEVIEGEIIEEQEMDWSYGLYSVLMFRFPGKIRVARTEHGFLWAWVENGEITIPIVDGIPVRPYEFPLLPSIPVSAVKSVEAIELVDNFPELYCEVYKDRCEKAPSLGNVLAIYTYAGKGIFGAYRAKGIIKTSVPVFSTPREYYTPKYENLRPEDWLMPDLRALVHWAPNINTDANGQASASFYNADNTGKMQVVIEVISKDGQIGYKELFFEVEKRKY